MIRRGHSKIKMFVVAVTKVTLSSTGLQVKDEVIMSFMKFYKHLVLNIQTSVLISQ